MVTTGFEETSMYQWIQSYLTSVPGGLPDVENDPYGSTLYAFRIAYVLMMDNHLSFIDGCILATGMASMLLFTFYFVGCEK